jgi:C4-type Zn-finger protein
MKIWKEYPHEECPVCGDDLEVFTDSKEEGAYFDGDDVTCYNCGYKTCVKIVRSDDELIRNAS